MCRDAKAPNNTNVLLASIVSRIVRLPTSYLRIQRLKIYEIKILYAVLYECKTWSVTLREGHRLKATEIIVLRKILGPRRRGKYQKTGENYMNKIFMVYTPFITIWVTKLRRLRWIDHVARVGGKGHGYKVR